VCCKDEGRKGNSPMEKFDFLGYTFRARRSKNRKNPKALLTLCSEVENHVLAEAAHSPMN